MKRIVFLAVTLAACAVRAALPSAERLLPADTLGFVTVPDWPAAQGNFSRSAYGQFFADPAMKAFADKLMANILSEKTGGFEREMGVKLKDYAGLVRGQTTLAITRNGWDGSPDKKPGLVWLIDTRDQSGQARTNLAELRQKWTDKGKKLRAEKIRDVEFITFITPSAEAKPDGAGEDPKSKPAPPTELSIGLSGTLLVLTDAPKDAEKVLALQSGSAIPALADQAAFAANAALARDSAVFAWVDARSIIAAVGRKTDEEKAQGNSLLGAGPGLDRMLGALGLSDVQTIAATVRDTGEGAAASIAINVPEAGRKGLVRILAVDQKDSSPPPFVPADAVKFSRWRIDLQKAWTTIETMLNEISPASGGVIKLLLDTAGKEKDPSFDLRSILLANLGDDLVSYEKAPRPDGDPASPPSVLLVGSKNADQMATSLKALAGIIPPSMSKYREREFLGRRIYSFTWPAMGAGKDSPVTYTASGGYVAISGDESLIEEYLRSNDGRNKPLRDTVGLNDAAQKVGGMNTGFFGYENKNESMRASFEAAKRNPNKIAILPGAASLPPLGVPSGEPLTMTNWFDPALLPAYERVAKYFFMDVAAVNVSPGAITFKLFSPTPPQLRK